MFDYVFLENYWHCLVGIWEKDFDYVNWILGSNRIDIWFQSVGKFDDNVTMWWKFLGLDSSQCLRDNYRESQQNLYIIGFGAIFKTQICITPSTSYKCF